MRERCSGWGVWGETNLAPLAFGDATHVALRTTRHA